MGAAALVPGTPCRELCPGLSAAPTAPAGLGEQQEGQGQGGQGQECARGVPGEL